MAGPKIFFLARSKRYFLPSLLASDQKLPPFATTKTLSGKFMKPLQRKNVIGGHLQYIQSYDVRFIIFRLTWANHGVKEEFHAVL